MNDERDSKRIAERSLDTSPACAYGDHGECGFPACECGCHARTRTASSDPLVRRSVPTLIHDGRAWVEAHHYDHLRETLEGRMVAQRELDAVHASTFVALARVMREREEAVGLMRELRAPHRRPFGGWAPYDLPARVDTFLAALEASNGR